MFKRSVHANNVSLQLIDLDGGPVGANITQMILDMPKADTLPTWTRMDTFDSLDSVKDWVRRNAWGALVINPGLSGRLDSALYNGTAYNPNEALTMVLSSGRHVISSIMFIQPAISETIARVANQYSLKVVDAFQSQQMGFGGAGASKTNVEALLRPIGYKSVDVAPDGFGLAPFVTLFGFLCMALCTLSFLITWKFSTFTFFLKVKFRDLAAMWIALLLSVSVFLSLHFSLAFLAYRGPDYGIEAKKYTAGSFFKIWFTSAAVNMALATWLFTWFLNLMPKFIALPSLVTVIPNVVSVVTTPEFADRFYKIFYCLPFYNGSRIFQTVTTGAYPHSGRYAGILIAEIIAMLICLSISIWLRQLFVLRGISDMHGWYRWNTFFHGMVPYYKDTAAAQHKGDESQIEPASTARSPSFDHGSIDINDAHSDN
ncbi:hypothetical protein EC988_004397, partial [Linderina pennispora]